MYRCGRAVLPRVVRARPGRQSRLPPRARSPRVAGNRAGALREESAQNRACPRKYKPKSARAMALASAEDAPAHVGKTAPGNEPNIGSVGDGVATYGYGFPGSCADSACGDEDELSAFDCNICLCTAENPVVTLCGHLYCWPCIYRWSRIPWGGHQCPVCKAALDRRQVIPIYARGKGPPPDGRKAGDGDAVVAGQMRPAPAAGGGLSSILGCILCPFGPPDPDLEEGEDEQGQSLFLSRVLLALGAFVIVCLLIF